jgi:hypothetical protein
MVSIIENIKKGASLRRLTREQPTLKESLDMGMGPIGIDNLHPKVKEHSLREILYNAVDGNVLPQKPK